MRRVAVFGATGSVGIDALDVVLRYPDRYRASVLSAHRNVEALVKLCALHRPDLAIVADPALEAELARRLAAAGVQCEVASGSKAVTQGAASTLCDTVIAAIPGLAGVAVTLAAARVGKRLLLAHQESAAVAGSLLQQAFAEGGGEWVPLSPALHAAYQCLSGERVSDDVARLALVTPGGPFLGRRRAELMTVLPDRLCTPSDRGTRRRTAVNIASLMDQGLHVIAAHQLFQLAPERVDLLVHTEERAYALIERNNGSLQAQSGESDSRRIIAQALVLETGMGPLERLSDAPTPPDRPDIATFRCLALAYQAAQAGGDAPAILNAANEVAVEAFLTGARPFLSIADLIEQVLMELPPEPVVDIQILSERDRTARAAARRVLRNAC
ncbi:1-deoxy-D-xylulose-5-phosphate reductoisomerase [Dyella flava]|uniref:1-deoxy-D-xylulose 5-phosphate reductoisomerase n=1 Tax=Dyella flava TaxID=1920170 RepID=A0ABS2K7R1_9GAMM|nr:1-deoxy-D-xylulose-5-phosphate reductoisomerase [Dyella flava]MBM7127216.1 1-deoxy-D-xylulose-5-phosphate reductoisomerase [Dyella flava]